MSILDPTAHTLVTDDLEAVFLPAHEMLRASLRHQGVEILTRVEDLQAAAARGSTAAIPLLILGHTGFLSHEYRVLGKDVVLDVSSPPLHLDENRLPMHGVPWSLLRCPR